MCVLTMCLACFKIVPLVLCASSPVAVAMMFVGRVVVVVVVAVVVVVWAMR